MRFAYNPYPVLPSPADRSDVDPPSADQWVFIHRPDLKVRVCGSGGRAREVSIWGLVDTGAAECILPHEVADQVKPKWRGTGMISDYAGRTRPVQYGQVDFQIRIEKKRLRWPAIVAFSRERSDEALWGRRGFLDHFSVTFNGPEKYFIIRLRGPVPAGFTVHPIPKPRRRGPGASDLITPRDQNP